MQWFGDVHGHRPDTRLAVIRTQSMLAGPLASLHANIQNKGMAPALRLLPANCLVELQDMMHIGCGCNLDSSGVRRSQRITLLLPGRKVIHLRLSHGCDSNMATTAALQMAI